jgi:hypothetical protein
MLMGGGGGLPEPEPEPQPGAATTAEVLAAGRARGSLDPGREEEEEVAELQQAVDPVLANARRLLGRSRGVGVTHERPDAAAAPAEEGEESSDDDWRAGLSDVGRDLLGRQQPQRAGTQSGGGSRAKIDYQGRAGAESGGGGGGSGAFPAAAAAAAEEEEQQAEAAGSVEAGPSNPLAAAAAAQAESVKALTAGLRKLLAQPVEGCVRGAAGQQLQQEEEEEEEDWRAGLSDVGQSCLQRADARGGHGNEHSAAAAAATAAAAAAAAAARCRPPSRTARTAVGAEQGGRPPPPQRRGGRHSSQASGSPTVGAAAATSSSSSAAPALVPGSGAGGGALPLQHLPSAVHIERKFKLAERLMAVRMYPRGTCASELPSNLARPKPAPWWLLGCVQLVARARAARASGWW